ncbi:uncharacterized protein BP5553_02388 [Venustampulla echinocandica]|uniref:Uncharacterized protein n=1 Tax=Venustampulla echinocandica TaxID=2656787 RepID=A0A370U3R1_9HELO|nr:uncharacterized protein BP5553_02388 [Venustampulla echinocandica]RDL42409.1 hypothetical protein BP5553_02388 [Venustampulla echinocandica]
MVHKKHEVLQGAAKKARIPSSTLPRTSYSSTGMTNPLFGSLGRLMTLPQLGFLLPSPSVDREGASYCTVPAKNLRIL